MVHPPTDVVRCLLMASGLALLGIACLQDWALRLVPNRIPLALTAIALALRLLDGTLLQGLLAGAIVFAVTVVCWRRGWLGGADVKLFTACAMLVAPGAALTFVLASTLAGGVLALAYLGLAAIVPPPAPVRPTSLLRRYARLEQRRLCRRGPLPYATAITAGAAFVLLGG